MANDHSASEASFDDGGATSGTDFEPIAEDDNQGGAGGDSQTDEGATSGEHDSGGESATGDGSSTDAGQDIQGTGDAVDEPGAQTETVDVQDYTDSLVSIEAKLDGLNASCLVLVFAMFVCAGALVVDTFVRSLEWRK